jgi:hypothetical protein
MNFLQVGDGKDGNMTQNGELLGIVQALKT